MNLLERILVEGVLGYLLQCTGYVLGICAMARKKPPVWRVALVSALFTLATFLTREWLSNLNFGIHTMLMLLIVNGLCLLVLQVEVQPAVIGSLLVTVLVLLGEVLDMGILLGRAGLDQAVAKQMLEDPMTKAWAAVPGNVILLVAVSLGFYLRAVRKKGLHG